MSDPARTRVALVDGAEVLIRPVLPSDGPLMAEAFTRLSPASRRARFLTSKDRLSASELRFFTDVDHHDHEAICAVSLADGRGVGAARYIRTAQDPGVAEVALTVIDEWQNRGLGTALLGRLLVTACRAGIRHITAWVSADNVAVPGLVRRLDAEVCSVHLDRGVLEYDIVVPRSWAR